MVMRKTILYRSRRVQRGKYSADRMKAGGMLYLRCLLQIEISRRFYFCCERQRNLHNCVLVAHGVQRQMLCRLCALDLPERNNFSGRCTGCHDKALVDLIVLRLIGFRLQSLRGNAEGGNAVE